MPNEIVLHIFDHARLAHDADAAPYRLADSDPVHSRRRINPVVAVSHVCRAWRALALDNPALWASLHLDGEMDGARAQDKARFWAERAAAKPRDSLVAESTGTAQPHQDARSAKPEPSGITSLFVTRAQDFSPITPDNFLCLFESLDLVELVRLRHANISWMGRGYVPEPSAHRLFQAFFTFLRSSADTLTSLTFFTPSHLRVNFSLQHFGETFTALEELEIRANQDIQDMARADRGVWRIPPPPASLLSIPPDFLPPPTVETGLKVLTQLRRLVLIGPEWRALRGGLLSHARVLDPLHVPALEYADLGRTTPNVNLGLLAHSSGTLSHLRVRNWWIPPAFPLPDILGSLPNLATLSLLASGGLATRILDELVRLDAATPIRFPHLVTLAVQGARLTQAHLALFGSDHAPRLATLDLSDTKAVASAEGAASLELPRCDALRTLKVARSEVWSTARSIVDELERGKVPALTQLYVSGSGKEGPVSGADDDDGWNDSRRNLLGKRGIKLDETDGTVE